MPYGSQRLPVIEFLLFCVLLVFCWPLALVALLLYPVVWLVLLPFRIVGVAVDGVLDLIRALLTLPVRLLGLCSAVHVCSAGKRGPHTRARSTSLGSTG